MKQITEGLSINEALKALNESPVFTPQVYLPQQRRFNRLYSIFGHIRNRRYDTVCYIIPMFTNFGIFTMINNITENSAFNRKVFFETRQEAQDCLNAISRSLWNWPTGEQLQDISIEEVDINRFDANSEYAYQYQILTNDDRVFVKIPIEGTDGDIHPCWISRSTYRQFAEGILKDSWKRYYINKYPEYFDETSFEFDEDSIYADANYDIDNDEDYFADPAEYEEDTGDDDDNDDLDESLNENELKTYLIKQINWCKDVLRNPYSAKAADAKANYGDNYKSMVKQDLKTFETKLAKLSNNYDLESDYDLDESLNINESPVFTPYVGKNEKKYGPRPYYIIVEHVMSEPRFVCCLKTDVIYRGFYFKDEIVGNAFPLLFESVEEAKKAINTIGYYQCFIEEADKHFDLSEVSTLRRVPFINPDSENLSAWIDKTIFTNIWNNMWPIDCKHHIKKYPDYFDDMPGFEELDESLLKESPVFTPYTPNKNEKRYYGEPMYDLAVGQAEDNIPRSVLCAEEKFPLSTFCRPRVVMTGYFSPILFESEEAVQAAIDRVGLVGCVPKEVSKCFNLDTPITLRRFPYPYSNSKKAWAWIDKEFFKKSWPIDTNPNYCKSQMRYYPDYFDDLPEYKQLNEGKRRNNLR